MYYIFRITTYYVCTYIQIYSRVAKKNSPCDDYQEYFTCTDSVKQVDVLPSKNQVLCSCYSMYCNIIYDVTHKSREQRLITKEHIAMHTNLILLFKLILQYFSDKMF